jgi:hypothetical protein
MFQHNAMALAIRNGNTIDLSPPQRRLLEEVTAIVAPRIGMAQVACRGFWLHAVLKWQDAHHAPIDQSTHWTGERRTAVVRELLEHFRKEVTGVLLNKRDRPMLDAALNEALQVYLTKYTAC